MKELVTEILAPLAAALNNIASAIRETSGTIPTTDNVLTLQDDSPAKPAPKAKAKAKEAAPVKEPEAPKITVADLADLAKLKLNKETGAYAENLPKIKAFLAENGIPKVTETPADKIGDVHTFLESLPNEGEVV